MHGELYAALVRTLEEPKSRGQTSPQASAQDLRPALAGSQAAVERHTPASSQAAAGGRKPAGSEAQEAQRVGRALRRDMERAGIHLAGSSRARLDALTARTHELGLVFGTLSRPRRLPALHDVLIPWPARAQFAAALRVQLSQCTSPATRINSLCTNIPAQKSAADL